MSTPNAGDRRLERLRHELEDEGIDLPADVDLAELVLAELDYARHPHVHEGVAPSYGAIVARSDVVAGLGPVEVVDSGAAPLATLRRLADGRSSFVARTVAGPDRLLCFDRTREYESSAVHLTADTGAIVTQRLGRGWVRLCMADAVATWDGTRWTAKPVSSRISVRLAAHIPSGDAEVLERLVEHCTHWLGAGRVGATLVWRLDGDPRELDNLGFAASVPIPELDVTRRGQFAALLNALSQYDRAALVDARGRVGVVGVHLRTPEGARDVAPYRGTRHTSALRFSIAAPTAVVFVVSSNGTLSVFRHGQRLDTD